MVDDLEAFAEALELNSPGKFPGEAFSNHWFITGLGLGGALATAFCARNTRPHVGGAWTLGRVRAACTIDYKFDAPSSSIRYWPLQAATFRSWQDAAEILAEASYGAAAPESVAAFLRHGVVETVERGTGAGAVFKLKMDPAFFLSGFNANTALEQMARAQKSVKIKGLEAPEEEALRQRLQRTRVSGMAEAKCRRGKPELVLGADVLAGWEDYRQLVYQMDQFHVGEYARALRGYQEHVRQQSFPSYDLPEVDAQTSDQPWALNALQ
eukprot:scaffold7871_cov376-Prasinococcus_capsulatus_cf.AAC.2